MKDFVSVDKLTKNYGDFCAVNNLSFMVSEGEIFGFLGPNGAGKSTTLSIIATLNDFDKGKVCVDGFDIIKNRTEAKRLMGIVPQDIAVYHHLSALENVKFFASLYGLRGSDLDRKAKEALEFVGLSDRIKMKPKQMSGGMQRRLNIACGIAHNPKLIVMDEPTVGVDAQSREHILNSIRILRERGTTIIYTSHYMQEVEEICDRIAIIDRGQLVAIGTKDELVSAVTDIQSFYITTKFPDDFEKEVFKKQIIFLPGVKNVSIEEQTLHVDLQVGKNSVTKILEEVIGRNLPIFNISSEVPNLDTTFLTLTGHELR
jgi:ABC-2 type transport system ATP-binding protein